MNEINQFMEKMNGMKDGQKRLEAELQSANRKNQAMKQKLKEIDLYKNSME
jgi:hypothetical protein